LGGGLFGGGAGVLLAAKWAQLGRKTRKEQAEKLSCEPISAAWIGFSGAFNAPLLILMPPNMSSTSSYLEAALGCAGLEDGAGSGLLRLASGGAVDWDDFPKICHDQSPSYIKENEMIICLAMKVGHAKGSAEKSDVFYQQVQKRKMRKNIATKTIPLAVFSVGRGRLRSSVCKFWRMRSAALVAGFAGFAFELITPLRSPHSRLGMGHSAME
jgi:hypothetical protein